MRERAAVYARYSSHSQTEQSIEGQIAAAERYAQEHDYEIVKTYCDRAKTGTNDNREEFQRMLADCSRHLFSVIIVWKVDRFGRNREEITFNKVKAKKHGVRVEYIAENITAGPEGVILESVLEGMAEYYSLQLAQNIRRGLTETAKKHKAIGGPVLGYRRDSEGRYEIDPDTAPIVRLIFEKYTQGMTYAELTAYLNERGYKTSRGKSFTKNSLPRILGNEKYIGVYRFKDQIRVEDAVPPIISRELFDQVQNIKDKHRRQPSSRWTYSDYILTDKLFCGHCGKPMVGKSGYGKAGTKYNYYTCSGRLKRICDKKPVRKEVIEDLVLSKIETLLHDERVFNTIVDAVWECYQKQDQEVSEIAQLESAIENVNKSLQNLIRSVEEGMPYALVKARLEELEEDKAKKEESLANLRVIPKLTKDHVVFFLEQFRKLDIADAKCQKRLIKTFVNSIYLYDDKVVVGFNYDGAEETLSLENINEGVRIEPPLLHFCQRMRTVARVLVVEFAIG